jgi:ribosomal protein S8
MKKLMMIGMIFLILSAFVSPAVAADTKSGDSEECKIFAVKSDEKAKLLESLEGKQDVMVYTAESDEDLTKITETLSQELEIDEKKLLKSIEKASEKSEETYSSEEAMTRVCGCTDVIIIVIILDDGTIIVIVTEDDILV